MAARKPFLRTSPEGEQIAEKLRQAAASGVTDEQLQEQRVSFAFGNASEGSESTKEHVREASNRNRLVPA